MMYNVTKQRLANKAHIAWVAVTHKPLHVVDAQSKNTMCRLETVGYIYRQITTTVS